MEKGYSVLLSRRIHFVYWQRFSISQSANPVWSISVPSAKVKKMRTLSRVEHVTSATWKYSAPCKRFAAAISGTQSKEPLESLDPLLTCYNQGILTKMFNIFPSLVLWRTMYAINKIFSSPPKGMAGEKRELTRVRDKKKKQFLFCICDNWKGKMFKIQIFSDDTWMC